jgi:hypothetical protein
MDIATDQGQHILATIKQLEVDSYSPMSASHFAICVRKMEDLAQYVHIHSCDNHIREARTDIY